MQIVINIRREVYDNLTDESKGYYGDYYCMSEALKNGIILPNQVNEVGHWTEEIHKEDRWTRRRFYCSRCGKWQTYGKPDYCPSCGAYMRGSD